MNARNLKPKYNYTRFDLSDYAFVCLLLIKFSSAVFSACKALVNNTINCLCCQDN